MHAKSGFQFLVSSGPDPADGRFKFKDPLDIETPFSECLISSRSPLLIDPNLQCQWESEMRCDADLQQHWPNRCFSLGPDGTLD